MKLFSAHLDRSGCCGKSGRRRALTRCRGHRVPDWAPGQGWPGRRPHHGWLPAVTSQRLRDSQRS